MGATEGQGLANLRAPKEQAAHSRRAAIKGADVAIVTRSRSRRPGRGPGFFIRAFWWLVGSAEL